MHTKQSAVACLLDEWMEKIGMRKLFMHIFRWPKLEKMIALMNKLAEIWR
jgi:hypothetical protein